MPRTVLTKHILNVSADEYMDLRLDAKFGEYKASLDKQAIIVPEQGMEMDAEGNELRWRSVELHFDENPVPPFLRGLVKSLMGEDLKLALEERNYIRRCSVDHPTTLKHRFPKALDEVLSVQSREWVVPIDDTQCAFHTQHTVTAKVFGMAGAIEAAIESGIKDGYDKGPKLLDAYLRHRDGKDMPPPAAEKTASTPSTSKPSVWAAMARWLDAVQESMVMACACSRKPERVITESSKISVTVEDAPEALTRVIFMTMSDGDAPCVDGRSRTISVSINDRPDGGRRITVDETDPWARPPPSRCLRCLDSVGCFKQALAA